MPAFDKRILGNIVRGGGVSSASCSAAGYQRGSFHHGRDPLFGVGTCYPEHERSTKSAGWFPHSSSQPRSLA